jgi:sialate O-acetylesterase
MINLPSVFSSGALFQCGTRFEIPGTAAPDSVVTAVLSRRGGDSRRYETKADNSGCFRLTLEAPAASFDTYDLIVADSEGETKISDILFGELWIASGQSNMEMPNIFMRDRAELYARMAGKKIRIFAQDWLGGLTPDGKFPFDEARDLAGRWITADDTAALDGVSACASAAVTKLYDLLAKSGAEVPVGFLNVSVGATTIETWLPREAVMDGGEVERYITKIGRLPTEEKFNTHGGANFTQPCALFNLKVAPLSGIRARGTLWYQGESNVVSRESGSFYLAALRAYHTAYQARFAPDGKVFQMICSQIFPWLYSQDECTFGYLNQAFIDAADAEPDKFGVVTVYDLPPVWTFGMQNHPIHPTNKYEIGDRMGMLAFNRCHGGQGLRSTVTMKSFACGRGRLTVRFDTGNRPLACPEAEPRGFYIADKSGLYVEANAKIRGSSVVLSHPHVKKPVHAAYMVSCLEMSGRVYCGGLPVAPFMTDREGAVHIEPKPWIHTGCDSVFVVAHVDADHRKIDAYPRPTWIPSPGTQICRDTVFPRTGGALRVIAGEDGIAEVSAPSYVANRLDMYNYCGMEFNIIGNKQAKIKVGFEYGDTETLWFDAVPQNSSDPDGEGFGVAFELPQKLCERVIFSFDLSDCFIKAVSVEKIVLIPKS